MTGDSGCTGGPLAGGAGVGSGVGPGRFELFCEFGSFWLSIGSYLDIVSLSIFLGNCQCVNWSEA